MPEGPKGLPGVGEVAGRDREGIGPEHGVYEMQKWGDIPALFRVAGCPPGALPALGGRLIEAGSARNPHPAARRERPSLFRKASLTLIMPSIMSDT